MTTAKSKPSPPSSPAASLGWLSAYALAGLALAGVMLLVWRAESVRPWQEEVRAINRVRADRLERRLLSAGLTPARAAARARATAQAPVRMVEITPAAGGRPERCLTCHQGIDEISPSHPAAAVGCVACHGGQGLGLSKAQAHRGLRGRNPSALSQARVSCGGGAELAGRCHTGRDQPAANVVYRVERTIMATMTGVLTSLRVAWGAQDDFTARLASAAVDDPLRPRPPPAFTLAGLLRVPGAPVRGEGFADLADEHWRKFCARCHLRAQRAQGPSAHGRGCAACHGLRDPSGRYQGDDACIADDQPGHAARHRLVPTPGEDACRRCHNRSGRLGLNYQGWMEDENGRTPWPRANPSYTLSGRRGVRRLLPDVHAEKGMSCIDCHTGREIMGDGRIYGRMRRQTEIRCASCHGGPGGPARLGPPDGAARFEAAYGALKKAPPLNQDDRLALGAKGRPLAALRASDKGLRLYLRSRPGQSLLCPRIDNDPAHQLPGHKRLACQACHSRWTPQCYGCHEYRRPGRKLWDYGPGKPTLGRWQETRDLYRFREPILGVDDRGRITTFVPACQVALTILDKQGRPVSGPRILRRGPAGNGIVSTPIAAHTTRREVRPCESCHMSPRALGLGGGPRLLGARAAQPVSDLSALDWPVDWDALSDGRGRPLQGNTHEGARPLNQREVAKTLAFARCLPCHRRAADPVLQDPARARARIGPGGDLQKKHRLLEEKALR